MVCRTMRRASANSRIRDPIDLQTPPDHWLPGFNFNVEEWDAKGQSYETLAICRTLNLARAPFEVAIDE